MGDGGNVKGDWMMLEIKTNKMFGVLDDVGNENKWKECQERTRLSSAFYFFRGNGVESPRS